jgi:hypothetical protein
MEPDMSRRLSGHTCGGGKALWIMTNRKGCLRFTKGPLCYTTTLDDICLVFSCRLGFYSPGRSSENQ